MMMRSQKALTLSVGPFYVMSTDSAIMVRKLNRIRNYIAVYSSFLQIIKATYSYVTLLRQTDFRKQE